MLKALTTVNNRRTLFLGLDRLNTNRLHEGKPIVIDVQATAASVDGEVQDVVLFAGETLAEAHAELSRYVPLPPFEEPEPEDG